MLYADVYENVLLVDLCIKIIRFDSLNEMNKIKCNFLFHK